MKREEPPYEITFLPRVRWRPFLVACGIAALAALVTYTVSRRFVADWVADGAAQSLALGLFVVTWSAARGVAPRGQWPTRITVALILAGLSFGLRAAAHLWAAT